MPIYLRCCACILRLLITTLVNAKSLSPANGGEAEPFFGWSMQEINSQNVPLAHSLSCSHANIVDVDRASLDSAPFNVFCDSPCNI